MEQHIHRWFSSKDKSGVGLGQGQRGQSPAGLGWIGKGNGAGMTLGIKRLDGFSSSRILQKSDSGPNRGRDLFGQGQWSAQEFLWALPVSRGFR